MNKQYAGGARLVQTLFGWREWRRRHRHAGEAHHRRQLDEDLFNPALAARKRRLHSDHRGMGFAYLPARYLR